MSHPPRPLITCRRCGQIEPHAARVLCGRCEQRCRHDGTLENYPRQTVSAKLVAEEASSPAMAGMSYVDIAMTMGLSYRSAWRSHQRARKRGLVP